MVNKLYYQIITFVQNQNLHVGWLTSFIILSLGIKLSSHQHLADSEHCASPLPPFWKRKTKTINCTNALMRTPQ